MQHLPLTLPDFKKASILVVGDIMLDRYWFGETSRISPEAPVPITKILNADHRPGGAGNVALNIAALGSNVTLLGAVGQDEAAQILQQNLTAASVKHDLYTSNDIATIIKLRIISKHQQLLRLDFEEKLSNAHIQELETKFAASLCNADLVILSDYGKGTLANPQRLISLARAAKVPVLVDPKGNRFDIYHGAAIITPNFKEFETVAGKCQNEQEIIDKSRALLKEHTLEALLITRGEEGMTLISKDAAHHMHAYAKEVFDVTGAGDTVIAALGSALAAQCSLVSAAALANLAASLTVAKFGAATVSPLELEAALSEKTHFLTGIVSENQLLQAVKQARVEGKKIVFTNGCFDILHAGHVMYLQMAKQLGDYLIVATNEDQSIEKLKGPNRPINKLEHRMMMLASLEMVDWVVPFGDSTPERLLKLIKPNLLVKGDDYTPDQIVGADIVKSYGGEVKIIKSNIPTSSTAILNKLHALEKSPLIAAGD